MRRHAHVPPVALCVEQLTFDTFEAPDDGLIWIWLPHLAQDLLQAQRLTSAQTELGLEIGFPWLLETFLQVVPLSRQHHGREKAVVEGMLIQFLVVSQRSACHELLGVCLPEGNLYPNRSLR